MLRIVVLLLALAGGGIAAWLTMGLKPATAPAVEVAAPAPQIKTEEVLVAAFDLAQGTALSDQELRWQTWPGEGLNGAFITRSVRPEAIETLSGSFVRHAMVEGEPIRDQKLSETDSGFLAARLPSGKRAVAVRVSAETSAGGFILPNDRVDVIHIRRDEAGARSHTILSSIRVLAIDQRSEDDGENAIAVGRTATLELDSEQAEAIAAAETSGSLSLALRSAADRTEAPVLAARHDEPPVVASHTGASVRIVRSGQGETVRIDGTVQ